MNPADVFVGAVSAIAGSLGMAAGVGNWEACYQLTKIRWLVNRVGRVSRAGAPPAGGIRPRRARP